MPSHDLNGIHLGWGRQGDGPPLMLIAGLASDRASWAPVLPALSPHFDLILPDNRGAGLTRPLSAPVSRTLFRDDLLALLDHLGLDRVALIGHSLGGLIALDLAATAPDRVSAIVAMSCAASSDPAACGQFEDLAEAGHHLPRPLWFRLLFQLLFSAPFLADRPGMLAAGETAAAYAEAQSPAAFSAQVAALRDYAEPADLARIACPVLALTGAADLLCPPGRQAASLGGLESLRTAVIPGAAHSLHWEAPAAVADAILGFLTAAG